MFSYCLLVCCDVVADMNGIGFTMLVFATVRVYFSSYFSGRCALSVDTYFCYDNFLPDINIFSVCPFFEVIDEILV